VGLVDVNIAKGLRSTSVSAYLAPVWNSPYLTVKLYSEATKIIFDASNQAQGVEFFDHISSKTNIALAQNEVILSAGAIGTPKLLMVSGIGNAQDLTRLGIPVVANVTGVGKILKDHQHINMQFSTKSGKYSELPLDVWYSSYQSYNLGTPGLLGSSGSSKIIHMFTSSTGNISNPNIQLEFHPNETPNMELTLQKTFTKGWVRLESSDPKAAPRVVLRDPLDEQDIDALLWGVNWIRGLVKTPPLSDIIDREISPGVPPEQLRQWIIKNAKGYNHYTGTCPLGDAKAVDAVTDTSLLVRNVKKLRIADASVLIQSGTGNIHNSVLAIGEIASDLILGKLRMG